MKIEVKNISYLDYLSLPDKSEYNYYLRFAEFTPLDLFNFGEFDDQEFGFVKDMQEILNNTGLSWNIFFEEIEKKTGKDKKELVKMSLFDLQRCRIFIKTEIEKINQLENSKLSHRASQIEEAAGINEFSKYGSFLQFDKLAGGDITKINQIRKEPYGICFTKLLLEAEREEFSDKYNKLTNK